MRVVLTAFIAMLLTVTQGKLESEEKCRFYCKECGEKGEGLLDMFDDLIVCESQNNLLSFLAKGPGSCKVPNFILSREQAKKYYPLRVCKREMWCIWTARRQRHDNALKRKMMQVLEQRRVNYGLMNEIRFSKQRDYVRAVDKLTDPKFERELKAHVKAKGFESKTQFKNPVFEKERGYLKENTELARKAAKGGDKKPKSERNKWKGRFNKDFGRKWKAITSAKSYLKSRLTRKIVDKYIQDIKKEANYVRQLQADAHRMRFLEKEKVVGRKGVDEKKKAVSKLRSEQRKRQEYRAKRRLRLTNSKRELIRKMRDVTKEVSRAQSRRCKRKK